MIRAGDTIENPITGERVPFLKTSAETGGELVVIETTVARNGFVAAEHLHPHQSERFEILEGEVEFKLDGEIVVARAGDVVMVESGTAHRFRNVGEGEEVRFLKEVCPALSFEAFLETMFGLASGGKTDAKGMPNPSHLAVIMERHFDLALEAMTHTLVCETKIVGDGSVPTELAGSVAASTLVIAGGESFPFMREMAPALADAIPDARARVLEGQTHNLAPQALAPVLEEFLAA